MKITKEKLIKHCEKQIMLNRMHLGDFSKKVVLEHEIFLELLKGRNINEIFDEKGECIENFY